MTKKLYLTEEVHTRKKCIIKDNFLSDYEIHLILHAKQLSLSKTIYIDNCEIEIKKIKTKDMKMIFNENIFIKNSTIFISKKINIDENLKFKIEVELNNKIIYSDYMEFILKIFNNNLIDIDEKTIKKLSLNNKDIRDVILPSNINFFKLIKNKQVIKTKLPVINFEKYDVTDVSFLNCYFEENTIMTENFFQKIHNKELIGCRLPKLEFRKSYIDKSIFMFTKFHIDSTFSNETDFLESFSILYGCRLPNQNYQKYSFVNANIKYCAFPEKSILPYSKDLANLIIVNSYPNQYIKNLHIMPIENIDYDEIIFKYGNKLTIYQKTLIYYKLNILNNLHIE